MPLRLFPATSWRTLAALFALSAGAFAEPIYSNDFEKAEVETAPADFMVMSGTFTVKQEEGNRFLELPGAPLDTFGLLFGPAQEGGASATARFFGTKQGRKMPTFGLSLNGVGGYRLQVSPGKKALELYKGDEVLGAVPWEWVSGSWTRLRLQVRKAGDAMWVVEGKAWPDGQPEPAKWTIKLDEKGELSPGRPGIWGSPYSGTPIRFDDLSLSPAS